MNHWRHCWKWIFLSVDHSNQFVNLSTNKTMYFCNVVDRQLRFSIFMIDTWTWIIPRRCERRSCAKTLFAIDRNATAQMFNRWKMSFDTNRFGLLEMAMRISSPFLSVSFRWQVQFENSKIWQWETRVQCPKERRRKWSLTTNRHWFGCRVQVRGERVGGRCRHDCITIDFLRFLIRCNYRRIDS